MNFVRLTEIEASMILSNDDVPTSEIVGMVRGMELWDLTEFDWTDDKIAKVIRVVRKV